MRQYLALATAPQLALTGEVSKTPDGEIKWHKVAAWKELGWATDIEDAKRKFGGSPVLITNDTHVPH